MILREVARGRRVLVRTVEPRYGVRPLPLGIGSQVPVHLGARGVFTQFDEREASSSSQPPVPPAEDRGWLQRGLDELRLYRRGVAVLVRDALSAIDAIHSSSLDSREMSRRERRNQRVLLFDVFRLIPLAAVLLAPGGSILVSVRAPLHRVSA